MDSFLRRLKYYGFGFALGLIFVVFFFQNRGCSWLPGNRVKNSILERMLVMPEEEYAALKDQGLGKTDLIALLNDGSVDFGASKKQGDPQVYVISKEIGGKDRNFYFTLPKESFIAEIHFTEGAAIQVKNSKEGYGTIVRFPVDDDLVVLDSGNVITCQQSVLGLINPRDVLRLIKRSGKIDFSKTKYGLRPKAEQYISFRDKKGRWIGARSIWYKNKVNITSFDLPFENDCH